MRKPDKWKPQTSYETTEHAPHECGGPEEGNKLLGQMPRLTLA